MASVYFLSDPHFGHKRIARFRAFIESTEHNDELIAQSALGRLNKRDKLYILGDVCFNKETSFKYVEQLANSVNKLVIVAGNHDFERPEAPTLKDYLSLGNVEVIGMAKYKGSWLTHCPIHEDELRGKFNVHGHTHYSLIRDLRYINVCVEYLLHSDMLISLEQIKQEQQSRKDFIIARIGSELSNDTNYKEYFNEYVEQRGIFGEEVKEL